MLGEEFYLSQAKMNEKFYSYQEPKYHRINSFIHLDHLAFKLI